MAINGSPVRRPGPPGPDPAWAWIGPALAGLVSLATLGLISPLLLWYAFLRLRNPVSFLCALASSALLVALALLEGADDLNLPVVLALWLGGSAAVLRLFRALAARPAGPDLRHGERGAGPAAPGAVRPGPAAHRR
ncbi:hypothetical protein ACOQFV_26945 [Nocardiopsis changdeensis]|uniref:Uncharacterized protein n=1 Tax=Nocardiopsis changdeensis TaxID=2831969 RepID=A0ABX8BLL6_9ACTN|nr:MULTISPECIES: hypothetical protein [Nocardiopsis]QUX23130.1 hypothetical protein KGD84_01620 [Nocardiopsis changdeensis]QYX39074.1 hypothetical protein K1J57_11075 [Nocardiopsis sp. MT53]